MSRLLLSVLGAFEAALDGKPLAGIKTDKARALLIYLVVERDRPLRRQALAGLFWPDFPEEGARANLRHALANLRLALGEAHNLIPFLLVEGETIQLNPECDCWVDVAIFEELTSSSGVGVNVAHLESAIKLYRGDFLEGFALKDSPSFDNWTALLRQRYLGFTSTTLGSLAELAEQNKDYKRAIGFIRKRLELEPWQEAAHRELMKLLALSGQRTAALAQYESCCLVLKEELGVEPSLETRRLQADIRQGKIASPDQAQPIPHNLPAQVTSFIGRRLEIEKIKAILGLGDNRWGESQTHSYVSSRLVTLTGPGGTGKTRLSLQVAAELLEYFPDGAWLVELAPLSDPELVTQTAARTLGMHLSASPQTLSFLIDFLKPRHCLLILDNCEHLVAACTELVDALLHACPHLRILASSREALGVEGEAPFLVPPLSLPGTQFLPSLAELEQYEGFLLFVERAELVSPGFHITAENAPAVLQICQRLDGIPLAIELAAARLKILSAEEIALRLDDRFRLLTSGSKAALPRYQSLRASLDWSYALLSDLEKTLLRRLSIFAGGWTLEAAEYVGCAEDIEACAVLDLLSELVNKSLVTVEAGAGAGTRYGLLETIRQYAQEKLVMSGEREFVCDLHLMYYVELAEKLEGKIRSPRQAVILSLLETELDNLRLAFEWSISSTPSLKEARIEWRIEHGLRLGTALHMFWHIRNRVEEGWKYLELLVARDLKMDSSEERLMVHAKALRVTGWMAHLSGDLQKANELFSASRIIWMELGLTGGSEYGNVLNGLGVSQYCQGNRSQARMYIAESLKIFRGIKDRFGIAENLDVLAWIAREEHKYDLARGFYEKALALYRNFGDLDGSGFMLYRLGRMALEVNDDDHGRQLFEESFARLSEANNIIAVDLPLLELGRLYWRQGVYLEARKCFDQVLDIGRRRGIPYDINYGLSSLGFMALSRGDYALAADYLAERLAYSRKKGDKREICRAQSDCAALDLAEKHLESALKRFEEELAISHAIGDQYLQADALYGLSQTMLIRGYADQASGYLKKALELSRNHLDWEKLVIILAGIAVLAAHPRNKMVDETLGQSAHLLGATESWHSKWQLVRPPYEREMWENATAAVREGLGEAAFMKAWEAGRAMKLEQAVEFARSYLEVESDKIQGGVANA